MKAKKQIEAYIKRSRGMRITAWVLLAVALIAGGAGAFLAANADMSQAEWFHPVASESKSLVYVDAVGISQWLYRDSQDCCYYGVEDAQGRLYTVYLSDKEYGKMNEQRRYWDREADSPSPAAYRIYGMAEKTGEILDAKLAEIWGITREEYRNYFGTLLLDANRTPGSEKGAMIGFVALIAVIAAFIIGCICVPSSIQAERCLRVLDSAGEMERAACQLQSEADLVAEIGKNRARLTEDYLFGRAIGAVVRYRDILWCYRRTLRYGYAAVSDTLIVCTKAMKEVLAINLEQPDKSGELEKAMAVILEKNPQVLVGFTKENKKIYRERRTLN